MAMNKIERIDREIQKTRKAWKHRKPKRKTCKSYSLCGL